MELEELKKSWQTLDRHLQTQNITTEERVAALVESYQRKTKRRLGNILSLLRASLAIGIVLLTIIGAIAVLLPAWYDNEETLL